MARYKARGNSPLTQELNEPSQFNRYACQNGRGGMYNYKSPELNPAKECSLDVKSIVASK